YGSFSLGYVWKSLLEPLHNSGDVSAYAPPLAFFLAVVAVMTLLRKPREGRGKPREGRGKPREGRVLFWLCFTAVACVLMMCPYSPLGPALYHIPVINRFRIPSRHAFEWTFGLSILSAYGWDALKGLIENRLIRNGTDFSLSARIHAMGRLKSAPL